MKKLLLTFLILLTIATPLVSLASLQDDINAKNELVETAALGADYEPATPQDIIVNIIRIALSLLSIIFIILIIVSGYQWMMAGGNSTVIDAAKKRIINAVIGLIIVIAAFAITEFVLDKVIDSVQ
ncbi:MAG: hypothetical protein ACKKL6_03960 [Candidatus Komeilibacteria bacterium]